MKKIFVMTIIALSVGSAFATNTCKKDCTPTTPTTPTTVNNGGSGTGVGVGIAGATSQSLAVGGGATIQSGAVQVKPTQNNTQQTNIGNGVGNFSPSSNSSVDSRNTNNNSLTQNQSISHSGNSASNSQVTGSGNSSNTLTSSSGVSNSGNSTVSVDGNNSTNTSTSSGNSTNVTTGKVDNNANNASSNAATNSVVVEGNTVIYEAQKRQPVASAYSGPLTSSNDTCMGSTSGGVQGVSIGISLATTWTDENCVMLKNSRELWNMGYRDAAQARMCMDSKNREAFELAGYQCPQSQKKESKVSENDVVASSTYHGNDPIVKARLGLK